MKKLLSLAFVASFAISLFAVDIFEFVPLKENPKNYTKIEYSIASKFGNYFRTPKVKYLHVFNDEGKLVEKRKFHGNKRATVTNYDDNGNPQFEGYYKTEIIDGEEIIPGEYGYYFE